MFQSVTETGNTAATRDVIKDFAQGADIIDLSGLDARSATAANDAFTFIGNAAFGNTAGQISYGKFDLAGVAGDITIISGDTNGDGVADFQIELKGSHQSDNSRLHSVVSVRFSTANRTSRRSLPAGAANTRVPIMAMEF